MTSTDRDEATGGVAGPHRSQPFVSANSSISSQFELSREEREEIRSILGLPPEIDLEAVGDRLKSHLEAHVDKEGLPVRADRTINDAEEIEISTWVDEGNYTEYDTWQLRVLIVSERNDTSQYTDHCIHLCDEHGLERWHIRVLETPTWDIKRVGIRQKKRNLPPIT